jgi:hypothetical protein
MIERQHTVSITSKAGHLKTEVNFGRQRLHWDLKRAGRSSQEATQLTVHNRGVATARSEKRQQSDRIRTLYWKTQFLGESTILLHY